MERNIPVKRIPKSINIFNKEMTPAYKLTYFPVKALAEPIRFLFCYGGIEFHDNRFDRENWPNIKPNMPFGQVPVLEFNGQVAHQSVAICRYIAKQVKLIGKNDWEDLEIDSIVDTINDFRQKIGLYHYETDTDVKESRKELLFNVTIPYYMKKFEEIVKKNAGYLAVERLTWADLYFVALLDYMNAMVGHDLVEEYSNLLALKTEVLAIPSIKNWVERRPKSDF